MNIFHRIGGPCFLVQEITCKSPANGLPSLMGNPLDWAWGQNYYYEKKHDNNLKRGNRYPGLWSRCPQTPATNGDGILSCQLFRCAAPGLHRVPVTGKPYKLFTVLIR